MSFGIPDYLAMKGIHPTRAQGKNLSYLCPLHVEETPSFWFYGNKRGDEHFHCFGCQAHGDLIGLIHELEGLTWQEAFERARDLGAIPREDIRRKLTVPREEQGVSLPASDEQIEAMFVLAQWCRQCLFTESALAKTASAYLFDVRGLSRDLALGPFPLVGYAPGVSDPALGEMKDFFARRLGEARWFSMMREIGLFTRGGLLRLQHRLLFFCYNERQQWPVFYQGRILPQFAEKQVAKFLNPPGVKKVPFQVPYHLPESEQALSGTIFVESPIGAVVGHQHGLFVVGTLGVSSWTASDLARLPRPHWLAQDSDEAGDKQAEKIAQIDRQMGWEHYRVRPPEGFGFDEWLVEEGPTPFLNMVGSVHAAV